ncbi:MAG: response regulator [Longimicrobiales bacterium]
MLVADDDMVFVELIRSRFKAQGIEVSAAFDAAQALMFAMRQQPDAILLDIRMPGGNGLDTLKKLKVSAKTAMIPVIVVTSLENPQAEQDARSLGAAGFLRKPVSFDDVQRTLEIAIGSAG